MYIYISYHIIHIICELEFYNLLPGSRLFLFRFSTRHRASGTEAAAEPAVSAPWQAPETAAPETAGLKSSRPERP